MVHFDAETIKHESHGVSDLTAAWAVLRMLGAIDFGPPTHRGSITLRLRTPSGERVRPLWRLQSFYDWLTTTGLPVREAGKNYGQRNLQRAITQSIRTLWFERTGRF